MLLEKISTASWRGVAITKYGIIKGLARLIYKLERVKFFRNVTVLVG